MDSFCHQIIAKFVKTNYVIRCLEMAGYDNLKVLQNLTDTDLDQVEDYARETCRMMPEKQRASVVGELFMSQPDAFRFPKGVRLGLVMAVDEMRKHSYKEDRGTQTIPYHEIGDMKANQVAATESLLALQALLPQGFPFPFALLPTGLLDTPIVSNASVANHFDLLNLKMDSSSTSSNNLQNKNNSSSTNTHIKSEVQLLDKSYSNLSKTDQNNAPRLLRCPLTPRDDIDMEKLRNRSNASVLRLSSKQFDGANLQIKRDFDITIETQTCENGFQKVAGIYLCHLCKTKRERSSPVRFSIAKNRYPVVSNIMSHLKMHFSLRMLALPSRVNATNAKEFNVVDFCTVSTSAPNSPQFSLNGIDTASKTAMVDANVLNQQSTSPASAPFSSIANFTGLEDSL